MTLEMNWTIRADVQDEFRMGEQILSEVVRCVHWVLEAHDGEAKARLYGSVQLPPPQPGQNFIDLSVLAGMDEESRRAQILAWADVVKPGFIASKEAIAARKIQAITQTPDGHRVSLL